MFFPWLASVLALGGLASLLTVDPVDFGRGFHRFTGAMAAMLLAAGLAGGALRGPLGWASLIACSAWVLLAHWGRVSWLRPCLILPVLLSALAVYHGTPYLPRSPLLELGEWMVPGNVVAASLLLGSVFLAMLLGHWYLVIPGLPVRHLRKMTWFLAFTLALRGAMGLFTLAAARPVPELEGTSAWRIAGGLAAFFYWQRIGIGLVVPAILTFLVERTVRIQSTQSATGLLYVATFFVLMGELLSRYLYLSLGIPQ
jgi:hypothetical protein